MRAPIAVPLTVAGHCPQCRMTLWAEAHHVVHGKYCSSECWDAYGVQRALAEVPLDFAWVKTGRFPSKGPPIQTLPKAARVAGLNLRAAFHTDTAAITAAFERLSHDLQQFAKRIATTTAASWSDTIDVATHLSHGDGRHRARALEEESRRAVDRLQGDRSVRPLLPPYRQGRPRSSLPR